MDDRIADLLDGYDLIIYRVDRVKGAWMLETDQGLKIFGSCGYSEGKVKFEQKVKQFAKEHGFADVDLYVPTREQKFLVQGPYGEMFIMKDWFSGEECDAKSREQVLLTVKTLGMLHNSLKGMELSEEELSFCRQGSLTELLEKRNKELRRVRTYIRGKKQKSLFEQKFLAQFDAQFSQAEQATAQFCSEQYEMYYQKALKEGYMLHGGFNHHSVIRLSTGEMAVTGFDKAEAGIQMYDFYLLFRKMMEKWDWDSNLGAEMLTAYDNIRTIPEEELLFFKIMLSYPEKFWKVANQYYNNRKSWIPEKNMQKLLQTMEQADKKKQCIAELF